MFENITQRIKAESPAFFKGLKKVAITVGSSAAAVMGANSAMSLSLPTTIITILSYTITVCVAIAGTSQLTTKE